jgi:GT2 family glycosyltransferase
LDDDCVVRPDTLEILLQEMERAGAEAAHPMTLDGEGRLSWAPGLVDWRRAQAVKRAIPPAEYLGRFGDAPTPFKWSQGIALLITRRALETLGGYRTDYWVRGEDLEFTLRITHRWKGDYAPRARVEHLPPAGSSKPEVEYVRHAAMLQNIAYTSLRLRHGWRIAWTLPSNWLNFWRSAGYSPRALVEIARTLFYGALLGWPAGKTYGLSAGKK